MGCHWGAGHASDCWVVHEKFSVYVSVYDLGMCVLCVLILACKSGHARAASSFQAFAVHTAL
jgi:hypothetical protein